MCSLLLFFFFSLLLPLLYQGFARRNEVGALIKEFCGSVHYSAPEICRGLPYSGAEVDVWSLGVTLYSLISGLLPFHGPTQQAVLQAIRTGLYTMISDFSEPLQDLIRHLLVVKPEDRLSLREILEHPWLQDLPSSLPVLPSPRRSRSNSSPLLQTPRNKVSSPLVETGVSRSPTPDTQLAMESPIPLSPRRLAPVTTTPSMQMIQAAVALIPITVQKTNSPICEEAGWNLDKVKVDTTPKPVTKQFSKGTQTKKAEKLQTFWRNMMRRRLNRHETRREDIESTKRDSSRTASAHWPFQKSGSTTAV
jgi:serine/threonine protein kinase